MLIPIAISFDKNYQDYALVMLSSLLENKCSTTNYHIFILSSDEIPTSVLNDLFLKYKDSTYSLIHVGDTFDNSYEVRDITIACYYRLLLPILLKTHSKIIYLDIDIIVNCDLKRLYDTDMSNALIAGVCSNFTDEQNVRYLNKNGLYSKSYINSGVLLMNLDRLRAEGYVDKFISLASEKYLYQDQDIINIVCKDQIMLLDSCYNLTNNIRSQKEYSTINSIIHFSGPKPWKSSCLDDDIWWYYYRSSSIFSLSFYRSKKNRELSLKQLTVTDVIKLLLLKTVFRKKIKYFNV